MDKKKNIFKRFLIMLALVVCIGTGYFAMSAATSCPAKAQMCCNCIADSLAGGLAMAISGVISFISVPLQYAQTVLQNVFFALSNMGWYMSLIETVESMTEAINGATKSVMSYNVVAGLRGGALQKTIGKSFQVMQEGTIRDAANLNRVKKESNGYDLWNHREQRLGKSVCTAATVTGGLARAESFGRAYNAAAPAEMVSCRPSSNPMTGRSGNCKTSAAASGAAGDMNARWKDYQTRYCKTGDNNGASGCTTNGAYAGLDLDITGTVFMKDTINLGDPEMKKLVDDMVINIAEPIVGEPVPSTGLDSASGSEAMLAAESYKAKRQAIYDSLYHITARRVPGSDMKEFIDPLRIAAGLPPSLSESPSRNEVMQVMMNDRFRNGKYTVSQIDEPENNQREMVIQQAFQMMQMSDQLDLMDRYAVMLAAQAGAEVRAAKRQGTATEGAPLP